MNYVNAPKSTLFAAATSFAVTLAVSASIVFGLAGLPQDIAAPVATLVPAASAEIA